jgi:aryl-alcohol dehydrogenase-like predicted oxidoreductase
MEFRFLGRTGVRVSSLALGTMAFGKEADERTAADIFGQARDVGINLFDCADVYAGGRAEEILGRLVAPVRNEVVLTSKVYFPTSDDRNARGTSRYHIIQAAEASLRRLGTDRIDVYFLHRFDDVTPLDETLRGIEQLVQQGKILYPAVSNFAAWQTTKALGVAARHGWAPIVCTQPMYNLVKRQAEAEILPMALGEGLGVMNYSPLGGGLLTGKYDAKKRPDSGRLVENEMYGVRYGGEHYYEAAGRFVELARAWGRHPASLAIAWTASHPAVTSTLIGARNVEQLGPCLQAAEIELTPQQREEIASLTPAPPPATDRNEETSAHNYGQR